MNRITRCKPYLGTYVEVSLAAEMGDEQLIEMSNEAFSQIARIDKMMSFHSADSELSRLNSEAFERSCEVSAEMTAVLQQALELSELTGGVFDISVAAKLVANGLLPDVGTVVDERACWKNIHLKDNGVEFSRQLLIDLGGIAKGYAVDQVFGLFDDAVRVTVNAGGDLRLSHWQDEIVAIRDPANPVRVISMPMQNAALASSASYYLDGRQVIISPVGGQSFKSSESVSVFADNCMLADALTKVVALYADSSNVLSGFGANAIRITDKGHLVSI